MVGDKREQLVNQFYNCNFNFKDHMDKNKQKYGISTATSSKYLILNKYT